MVALLPVQAHVVRPEHAAAVVGVAYDALRPAERRRQADENPDSFFNVIRSEVDYDGDGPPEDLLVRNAAALERLLRRGRYERYPSSLYAYRLSSPTHGQVAVVGDLEVSEYRAGRVRAHEQTREAKEAELARHLAEVRMHSSPVGLGYRAVGAVDATVAEVVTGPPIVDLTTPDSVRHEIWPVRERAHRGELITSMATVEATYIVDGHHRVGAAARLDPNGRFLAALIPHDQLHVLPYHRVVAGSPPRPLDVLVDDLSAHFVVTEVRSPPLLGGPAELGLYHRGRWWHLVLRGPVAGRVPAALADDLVLRPVLGVTDARTDPRLEFVPGGEGVDRLAAVADERDGVAVALTAPTVEDVFAQADAGRTLPPKSTWFEPKLRSGLIIVRR